jgi:hypothetical protein
MGGVIVELLPLILGAALVPLYSIAVLLLLESKNGLLKAGAFVSGEFSRQQAVNKLPISNPFRAPE